MTLTLAYAHRWRQMFRNPFAVNYGRGGGGSPKPFRFGNRLEAKSAPPPVRNRDTQEKSGTVFPELGLGFCLGRLRSAAWPPRWGVPQGYRPSAEFTDRSRYFSVTASFSLKVSAVSAGRTICLLPVRVPPASPAPPPARSPMAAPLPPPARPPMMPPRAAP